mmetsp:Transcript_3833/g.5825  ORF Transcript_3833/g.5825 Transcript_3833/m.5825 type:complete len:766 (-) Transcript_3833:250-2547(-)
MADTLPPVPPQQTPQELTWAIEAALKAVELDQMGNVHDARLKFVEAADWLLIVMKRETDEKRRDGLRSRIENYLNRAEALQKQEEMLKRKKSNVQKRKKATIPEPLIPPALNANDSRSRKSTAEYYFTADETFRNDVARARATVAKISKEAKQNHAKFIDPEFSADRKALVGISGAFVSEKTDTHIQCWLRVKELDQNFDIFPHDPNPKDVDQGALGNCYLLSSLSVLAAFPELIRRLLIAYDLDVGIIATRLCYAGRWRLVYIDDRLPCRHNKNLVFAQPKNNAVWCCILEKALAKLHGAYNALDNGTAAEALGLLTGLPTSLMSNIHQEKELETLFNNMQNAYNNGSIISASCGHTGIPETKYEQIGLRHAHEYAVLRLKKVQNIRFVELRNPWARGEFKGRWCRSSKEWTTSAGQELLNELLKRNPEKNENPLESLITDDGIFWMQLEDVAHYFHEITICRLRRNFSQRRLSVCGGQDVPRPSLHGPYRAFLIETANQAVTLDACLVQATERGKLPIGHHVMADAWLSIFRINSNTTPQEALENNMITLVSTSDPGMLAAVVAADEFIAEPNSRYLIVPFFFNWRVLRLDSTLTAVLYASIPLSKLSLVDLDAKSTALALRCLTVTKGKHQGSQNNEQKIQYARLYDFHGIHLMENTHQTTPCAFSLALGKCTNLVSSRHGGVLDPDKPAGTYSIQDTVPPRTFQINLIRSPFRASWAIDSTKLSWKFVNSNTPISSSGSHNPPLPSTISIHTPFSIPSSSN